MSDHSDCAFFYTNLCLIICTLAHVDQKEHLVIVSIIKDRKTGINTHTTASCEITIDKCAGLFILDKSPYAHCL